MSTEFQQVLYNVHHGTHTKNIHFVQTYLQTHRYLATVLKMWYNADIVICAKTSIIVVVYGQIFIKQCAEMLDSGNSQFRHFFNSVFIDQISLCQPIISLGDISNSN